MVSQDLWQLECRPLLKENHEKGIQIDGVTVVQLNPGSQMLPPYIAATVVDTHIIHY